ncbi:acyl-coenzyme A amino acid N-acyltransferase 2-like [Clavelina lepadiformis]|uniref:acyl-coenzyme A amino acid N-acyltransferase 2-like n=1 Tax=Clavelina lepadiformis TaxID=159417 RepID=UPI004042FE85
MEKVIINAQPNPSLYDEPIAIKANGLKQESMYTFHSHVVIERDEAFECLAQYKSDSKGIIDLGNHASLGGSYTGIEPMGLFWAMKPATKNKYPFAVPERKLANQALDVTISAHEGALTSSLQTKAYKAICSVKIQRRFMAPGVTRTVVRDNGLHAFLFLPPGPGPFPGIITIDGLMPGTNEDKPALLASRGYAALGLPFYGIEGLPQDYENTCFKLEYFESALRYLQNHEKVDAERGIGLVTLCLGLHFGLAMATFLSGISCMIGINGPLSVLHNPMSYKGIKWSPHKTLKTVKRSSSTNAVLHRTWYNFPATYDEAKASTLEFYKKRDVAFMFVAALDDDAQASEYYVNVLERLLKESNHPVFRIDRYSGAGHVFKQPYMPHSPFMYNRIFGETLGFGGVTGPHSKAQEDSWKKQLGFLHKHLKLRRVNPAAKL